MQKCNAMESYDKLCVVCGWYKLNLDGRYSLFVYNDCKRNGAKSGYSVYI